MRTGFAKRSPFLKTANHTNPRLISLLVAFVVDTSITSSTSTTTSLWNNRRTKNLHRGNLFGPAVRRMSARLNRNNTFNQLLQHIQELYTLIYPSFLKHSNLTTNTSYLSQQETWFYWVHELSTFKQGAVSKILTDNHILLRQLTSPETFNHTQKHPAILQIPDLLIATVHSIITVFGIAIDIRQKYFSLDTYPNDFLNAAIAIATLYPIPPLPC